MKIKKLWFMMVLVCTGTFLNPSDKQEIRQSRLFIRTSPKSLENTDRTSSRSSHCSDYISSSSDDESDTDTQTSLQDKRIARFGEASPFSPQSKDIQAKIPRLSLQLPDQSQDKSLQAVQGGRQCNSLQPPLNKNSDMNVIYMENEDWN